MIFSSPIPTGYTPCSLVHYLARRFTYLSADDWRGQLALGRITRNGLPCLIDEPVQTGDTVGFALEQNDFPEPAADLSFQIVYEDDWLLGINKPGNLLVHRQGRSVTHNLLYQLRHVHQPSYPRAGAVNRLDRETSGVVLVARHPDFLAPLNALFSRQEVTKTYLAVVRGRPALREGVIDAPIGRDPDSVISYRYLAGDRSLSPKSALTVYQVMGDYGDRTLLRLQPKSGRTHQLRVHLAHIGHPIMGDKLYGRTDQEFLEWRERPPADQASGPLSRQALHAESLQFIHPWTGKETMISVAMPSDMDAWLDGEEGPSYPVHGPTG